MKRSLHILVLTCAILTLAVSLAMADNPEIQAHKSGTVTLTNAPDYDWWYGCSPTSAGMMMGYYDRQGYSGLSYSNLVPGGVAESSNYGNPGALANQAIASSGHVNAFYRAGYGASGDDIPALHTQFDCLADFMGTSQDPVGNSNGSTTFWYWTNGARFTAENAVTYNVWTSSGMYGMGEYVQHSGYNYVAGSLFNQYIDTLGLTYGFTFAQYMAEIDAGRPVLIQVEGHTMFGFGYDANTSQVVLYDTWTPGPHYMTWGGYYSGLHQYGVTCLELTGGSVVVPLPPSLWLLGSGLLGVLALGRKKFTHRN